LFCEGPAFIRFVRRVSPLSAGHTEIFFVEFRSVAVGLFWGYLVTAALHGVLFALGYALCGVQKALLLALLSALASVIPIVGTALVWIPACLVLAASGRVAPALLFSSSSRSLAGCRCSGSRACCSVP
jgi:predicted PurR-regulated permease PerM